MQACFKTRDENFVKRQKKKEFYEKIIKIGFMVASMFNTVVAQDEKSRPKAIKLINTTYARTTSPHFTWSELD